MLHRVCVCVCVFLTDWTLYACVHMHIYDSSNHECRRGANGPRASLWFSRRPWSSTETRIRKEKYENTVTVCKWGGSVYQGNLYSMNLWITLGGIRRLSPGCWCITEADEEEEEDRHECRRWEKKHEYNSKAFWWNFLLQYVWKLQNETMDKQETSPPPCGITIRPCYMC